MLFFLTGIPLGASKGGGYDKEGEKKDADNNAGRSGVVSVVSVVRNTFWVSSAHPVKAAPARKKEQLERILFQIFYYLTAGHLLESKSLMEVLIVVKILLTWLSFIAFTW